MPPTDEPAKQHKSLQEVVDDLDRYPLEAFHFVQQGLSYTVDKIHTGLTDPNVSRHISGQQLSEGLREYALLKWGMLARTVLRRWNINATFDFGRIVFAMVESGLMHKTEEDTVDDFRDVYDFKTAFESGYQIPLKTLEEIKKSSEGRPT